MTDRRIENLARTLVRYSTKVEPQEEVAIYASSLAKPLVQEVYKAVLRAGGYPVVLPRFEGYDYFLLSEGKDDQLQHVSRIDELAWGEFPVMISIRSESNTKMLSNIDPARQQLAAKARAGLVETFARRSAEGELRWVVTLFPTAAYAQDAEMSLGEFEDYVFSAAYADVQNPVEEWQEIHDQQQGLVEWLEGKKEVVVKGPNVDLSLSIEGRAFLNADGTRNMPSGEIFTSPVEDSVNGVIRFTHPAVRKGRQVEGVELHFENGRVVKASAAKNEEYLRSALDTDSGARYLGEFAIGTNKKIDRFIKNILFDEKIGGTIHIAVGDGFREVGSKNKSAIHWDMICDMREGGQIYVDDELFYESGEFKI